MKNLSFFQVGVIGVFIFLILIAALIFSGILPGFRPDSSSGGTVSMWGSIPSAVFKAALQNEKALSNANLVVNYTEIAPASFEARLVDALARGEGPDLIVMPHTLIYRHADKVQVLPNESLSARDYADTFVEEGDLFRIAAGSIALPLYVDPLVMYVTRDSYSAAGYPRTPELWEQFFSAGSGSSVLSTLTAIDARGTIEKSAIALGDFSTVSHAKDIMSLLLLQSGNAIVAQRATADGEYVSILGESGKPAGATALSVNFFTQFADRGKTTYTWSGALPKSKDAFSSGVLASYLGFASELPELKQKNPHLNFDMTLVPQRAVGPTLTFGNLYGVAVLARSRSQHAAFNAAGIITGKNFSGALAKTLSVASARRDALDTRSTDPLRSVIDRSALIARGWLDPNPAATETIFGTMVQSTIVGRAETTSAVSRAHQELTILLNRR